MTVDTRDILLKAAEDVTQGMWCKGEYFQGDDIVPFDFLGWPDLDTTEDEKRDFAKAQESKRCALGSLALATKLLGGNGVDWDRASSAVWDELERRGNSKGIAQFNDNLPDDPFEAGQQLADLFRTTAESL